MKIFNNNNNEDKMIELNINEESKQQLAEGVFFAKATKQRVLEQIQRTYITLSCANKDLPKNMEGIEVTQINCYGVQHPYSAFVNYDLSKRKAEQIKTRWEQELKDNNETFDPDKHSQVVNRMFTQYNGVTCWEKRDGSLEVDMPDNICHVSEKNMWIAKYHNVDIKALKELIELRNAVKDMPVEKPEPKNKKQKLWESKLKDHLDFVWGKNCPKRINIEDMWIGKNGRTMMKIDKTITCDPIYCYMSATGTTYTRGMWTIDGKVVKGIEVMILMEKAEAEFKMNNKIRKELA
tara:strand:- start:729 stop:1607 length:879 start_codon:yes stop_codon:yes gene_type:complete